MPYHTVFILSLPLTPIDPRDLCNVATQQIRSGCCRIHVVISEHLVTRVNHVEIVGV